MSHQKRLSFEFFPPKTLAGQQALQQTYTALNTAFNPDFCSVTYGAGGSTREHTQSIVLAMQAAGINAAPHLSFGMDDETTVLSLLNHYRAHGIQRIVALRGDRASGMGERPRYAKALVAFIRQHTGDHFQLEVGAYPEIHPDASSYEKDIMYLKDKLDAGANHVITQYFFNTDAYFYFVDACRKAGIEQPIYPGIMPLINYERLVRFSQNCGAQIPRWMHQFLHGKDQATIQQWGIEWSTRCCERLLAGGAPGLHFYTMNHTEPMQTICRSLGLGKP